MPSIISNINIINFPSLVKKRRLKQVGSLYTSMLLSIIFGIGVSIVNTRLLGPKQYGDLKFLQNLFSFVVTFMTFGVFVTGARLLAQNRSDSRQKDIIGSLSVFAALISIIFISILFFFSFFENRIFNNDLGLIIRILCPLLFVFPFTKCLEGILVGTNEIYKLSIYRIAPQILYIFAVTAFTFLADLTVSTALLIQFMASFLVLFVIYMSLKPRFNRIAHPARLIIKRNKSHGFQVYIGSIFSIAGAHLVGLFIGLFMDNINVGYYSLALMTTMPLTMIPNAIGTTFYRDFASLRSLPAKATRVTILLSSIALLFFVVMIRKIILLLYSTEYIAVVPLAYLISIGCFFHGFGDYINRFIGSHGKGKFTRNGAISVGIVNILGCMVLIRFFGLSGAATTRILSGTVYLGVMLFYYNKLRRSLTAEITQ